MAEMFTVTAPLLVRFPDKSERLALKTFAHPRGVFCLDVYEAGSDPVDALYLLEGELKGEGPWKVGDCVVTVLGCQNTNPGPAGAYAAWRQAVEVGAIAVPDGNRLKEQVRDMVALA